MTYQLGLFDSAVVRVAMAAVLVGVLAGCGGGGDQAVADETRVQVQSKSGNRTWTLTPIGGAAGEEWSEAVAINNAGQVAFNGASIDAFGFARVWQNGRTTDLGTLGPFRSSQAVAINERGQVVGTSYPEGALGPHAFLWSHGAMIDLGTFGGPRSNPDAINNRGQVVGSSNVTVTTGTGPPDSHAALWQDGTMTDLGTLGGTFANALAVNERGQIVGHSETPDGSVHAFLWEDGVMIDLGTLGGANSYASAINDRGEIVGGSDTASGERRAFLWKRQHGRGRTGSMTDLGAIGEQVQCTATAISVRSQIIGDCEALQGPKPRESHAFVWERGVMTDLGALGPQDTPSHVKAWAINARGQIVGASVKREGEQWQAFVWERENAKNGGGVMTALGPGWAKVINESGQIAGWVPSPQGSDTRLAALWTRHR